jgi:hypothetical protein
MKNKFEALSTFQSWPEDWQRLCAEYWAENDKPSGSVTTSIHSLWAEMHQGIKQMSNTAQYVEPQAVAKTVDKISSSAVIVRKRKKNFRPRFWTAIELEYLHKCHESHARNVDAAKMFLAKYPGRSEDAIEIQIRKQVESGWKINY